MKKLFTLFTMLLMMVTASFADSSDDVGNITVTYHPANKVLDIIFENQTDVAPSWNVDITLDGDKLSCEYGLDWNELFAYPHELTDGKHTIVFPAGSLLLSGASYDKECSVSFVLSGINSLNFSLTLSECENVYTVTSFDRSKALYYLCKPYSWLDEGETPESVLQSAIEDMGTMIDSKETWDLYDHMGLKPAPKVFNVADYQEMYAGEDMFIIAAQVGWDGEKLAVISNIVLEDFTVSSPAPAIVLEKIATIGKVEYNDYCYALIYLARAAYDKLTADEKALISPEDYKVLTDAEETYAKLKAEGDKAAADNVIALINAIGTVEYTAECKELIDMARDAYEDLIKDQKALISAEQYKVLTDAEAEYKRLEGVVTGIDNADAANAMKDGKYIQNGMIIIVKNGKQYNAQGHIIK